MIRERVEPLSPETMHQVLAGGAIQFTAFQLWEGRVKAVPIVNGVTAGMGVSVITCLVSAALAYAPGGA